MSRLDALQTRLAELSAFARVARNAPRFMPGAAWSPARLLELRAGFFLFLDPWMR